MKFMGLPGAISPFLNPDQSPMKNVTILQNVYKNVTLYANKRAIAQNGGHKLLIIMVERARKYSDAEKVVRELAVIGVHISCDLSAVRRLIDFFSRVFR